MSRFESWAVENGIEVAVKRFPAGTRTAEDAARAVGCELGQIVKSLVFLAAGQPVVALVSGANRVDLESLASVAGGPVERAGADRVREATGYSIGGVPPFGHAHALRVFVDRDLTRWDVVWAAAGTPDAVFEVTPTRLVELSGGAVADLAAAS